MAALNKILAWQHTKTGELVSSGTCLLLAYLFFSLSINTGNLFYYIILVIFMVYCLKFFFRFIGEIIHVLFH